MWSLGNPTPNMTLEGHEKGVNCVDYYSGRLRGHNVALLVDVARACSVAVFAWAALPSVCCQHAFLRAATAPTWCVGHFADL